MATIQVILVNGTTADADDVMDNFYEIYSDIDSSNVGSGNKTGTGKFVLDTAPTFAAGTITIGGTLTSSGGGISGTFISSSLVFTQATSGSAATWLFQNSSNTASSQAVVQIKNGGVTASAAYTRYSIGSTYDWTFGAFQNGNLYLQKSATFTTTSFAWEEGGTGAINAFTILNSNNTASSASLLNIKIAGTTALSAHTLYTAGSFNWCHGILANGTFGLKKTTTLSTNAFLWDEAGSGGTNYFEIANANNTASSRAYLSIYTGGASASDPQISMAISGVTNWAQGIKNDDSDRYHIQKQSQISSTTTNYFIFMDAGGSGADNFFAVSNLNNTASSQAIFDCVVGGSSSADAVYKARINGSTTWAWGLDNSTTNDNWTLSNSATLGTNNVFAMTTEGKAIFSFTVSDSATHNHLLSAVTNNGTGEIVGISSSVANASGSGNATGLSVDVAATGSGVSFGIKIENSDRCINFRGTPTFFFDFTPVLSTTALGAYKYRIPIRDSAGATKYIPAYDP